MAHVSPSDSLENFDFLGLSDWPKHKSALDDFVFLALSGVHQELILLFDLHLGKFVEVSRVFFLLSSHCILNLFNLSVESGDTSFLFSFAQLGPDFGAGDLFWAGDFFGKRWHFIAMLEMERQKLFDKADQFELLINVQVVGLKYFLKLLNG